MIYGQNPSKESRPVQTDADGRIYAVLTGAGGAAASLGSTIANIAASFSRPENTTAYTAGDLVANSTTAGSVTPLSFASVVRTAAGAASVVKCRMSKTGTGVTGASFRLHLFSASPTVTNGDNGAFLSTQAATYLGAFDFSVSNMKVFSDGVACNGVTQTGYPVTVDLPSGSTVYGLVEALAGYNPASGETFTFTLELEQE
jgi:hypothetical protein